MKTSYKITIIFFVISVLIIGTLAFGETPALQNSDEIVNLFQTGNTYFQEKKFEDAQKVYEQIIAMGIKDPVLFYNAGNSFYMTGHTGKAIVLYEKALRFSPRDEDIKYNLNLTSPASNSKQPFFLFIPYVSLYNLFSLNEWIIIANLFFVLTLVIIGFYFLLRNNLLRKILRIVYTMTIILFAVSICFLVPKYYNEQIIKEVVVISKEALAMSGPSEEFSVLFKLPEGTKAQLISNDDKWSKIRLSNDKEGYIKNNEIENI